MNSLIARFVIVAALATFVCAPASAYIGPGSGITVLGALWGVIVAIAVTIGAIVIWPFRILLRRHRNRKARSTQKVQADAPSPKDPA
jgi:hypothetical protein